MMRSLILGGAAVALMACGDSSSSPNEGGQVAVGFQLARTSAATAADATVSDGANTSSVPAVIVTTAAGLQITRGPDVLVINKAQLVVRDVKLKNAAAVCSEDESDEPDKDCPTLRVGPFLLDVPVDGSDGPHLTVPVPPGTYSSLRLTIHKVTSSSSADLAFRQTYPDFRDISVRLEGTYNGVPFTFVNDVNAKLEIPLPAPLVVGSGGGDVTVSIDIAAWFVNPQGGLFSPAIGNTPGSVRASIQNNIRVAFKAFKDKNHDGNED